MPSNTSVLDQTEQVAAAVAAEAAEFTAQLIRIDTTNTGEPETTKGEREAAEFVVGKLEEVGLSPKLYESAPGRANVVVRIEGQDQTKPALVVHGHLDVVPAVGQWQHNPFGGEVIDGVIWGRGAVDMKDMDAMMLAVIRDFQRRSVKPARDLILTFFADEENGGNFGSQWMVTNHADLFHGATEAISEAGGFSMTLAGHRVYLIETAEKAIGWMRLTANGTGGHGSFINPDNAVAKLVAALERLNRHQFPPHMTATMRAMVTGLGEILGVKVDPDNAASVQAVLDHLGGFRPLIEASMATHINLTSLDAGGKANTIPPQASATVDMRPLPDQRDEAWETVTKLLGPDITIERLNDHIGMEAPLDGPIFAAMAAALTANDPDVPVLPLMMPGGTDNKALARLGINGYGFTPLSLPPDYEFWKMFHGVDERVPESSLAFGTQALSSFLSNY